MNNGVFDKIRRRVKLGLLGNIIGAQGLFDMDAAKRNCLPYLGAVGLSNLGDEVVLEAARKSFATRRIVAAHRDSILQRFVLHRCIRLGVGMLVGGGTVILSDSALSTLEEYKKQGLPYVTFGTGVHDPAFCGPLDEGRAGRWLSVLKNCVALGVRGPLSKRILDDLEITNAQIVGDPAVLHTRPEFRKPRPQQLLGVNIGTAWGRVWGNDERGVSAKIADSLALLKKAGWKFRFFCVWPYDLPVIREVAARAGLNDVEIVEEYYSGERFIEEVAECRCFVGMKLHAVILSVCAGVPSLCLEYRPKLRDYMASIGSESELLRFDEFTGVALKDAIERLSDQADAIGFRQWSRSRELAATFSQYVGSLNESIQGWSKHPTA